MSDEVTAAPHVMHWIFDSDGPVGVSHHFMCRDCGLETHTYEKRPCEAGNIDDTQVVAVPCIRGPLIFDAGLFLAWLNPLQEHYQGLIWNSGSATDTHKAVYQSWVDALSCVGRALAGDEYKAVQA